MFGKTDEILRIVACNIRVQPLQHMQHPDFFCNIRMKDLQHTSEHLKHLKHTLVTCVFHPSFVRRGVEREVSRGASGDRLTASFGRAAGLEELQGVG
jgi:hypothetical protein